MDVCHTLLGRPWKYDREAIHDGKKNTYKFHKDGIDHMLILIKDEGTSVAPKLKVLLLSGKQYLQQVEEGKINFAIVCKLKVILTSTKIYDWPIEIQDMLSDYNDIILDDFPSNLPPTRSINHHLDLIQGETLPNKAAYRMTHT